MSGRTELGITAIQRDGVEGRRQAGGGLPGGEQVEAAVGARRVTFPGEHPGRRLARALEREHARGEREEPGEILRAQEAHNLAVIGERRQRDPVDGIAGQGRLDQRGADLLAAHHIHLLVPVYAARVAGHAANRLRRGRVERRGGFRRQVADHGGGGLVTGGNQVPGGGELLSGARLGRLVGGDLVIVAHGRRDLGEIALAPLRQDRGQAAGDLRLGRRQQALELGSSPLATSADLRC
jgi:hypothetical protein